MNDIGRLQARTPRRSGCDSAFSAGSNLERGAYIVAQEALLNVSKSIVISRDKAETDQREMVGTTSQGTENLQTSRLASRPLSDLRLYDVDVAFREPSESCGDRRKRSYIRDGVGSRCTVDTAGIVDLVWVEESWMTLVRYLWSSIGHRLYSYIAIRPTLSSGTVFVDHYTTSRCPK